MIFRQNFIVDFFMIEYFNIALFFYNTKISLSHLTSLYYLDILSETDVYPAPHPIYCTAWRLLYRTQNRMQCLQSYTTIHKPFSTQILMFEDTPYDYSAELFFHFTVVVERLCQFGWFAYCWIQRWRTFDLKAIQLYNHLV